MLSEPNTFPVKVLSSIPLFSKKDGDDKKSVHDMIVKHLAHPFSHIRTDVSWRNGEQSDFLKLATLCFEAKETWTKLVTGQELRGLLIGISRMSFERFEPFYFPKTGNLLSNVETLVWFAANTILGSTWCLNIIPQRQLTKKVKPIAKACKSIAFAPDTITAKTLTGTFLHRNGVCSSDSRNCEDVTAGFPRTIYTFFTIRLLKVKYAGDEGIIEGLANLHCALTILFKRDPRFVLCPFPLPIARPSFLQGKVSSSAS